MMMMKDAVPRNAGQPIQAGKACQLSVHCSGGTICTKGSVCERTRCTEQSECDAISKFPSKCTNLVGKVAFCKPKTCDNNQDCATVGSNYGCHGEQCKPHYGDCFSTCDCVDKYKMVKGEAICHHSKCYCRTAHLEQCFSGQTQPTTPQLITTSPKPMAATETMTCPAYGNKKRGQIGEKCRAHTGCVPFGNIVCVKPKGQEEGTCQRLECQSNDDCTSKTDLPLECLGKICRKVDCASSKDCPQGYGCYKDNQCRKILGQCEFDCDCSECPGVQCFRQQCFCMNDQDDCDSMTGFFSKMKGLATREMPKKETCLEPKLENCPAGWTQIGSQCYILSKEPKNFDESVKTCTSLGGFVAEIQGLKEFENVLQHVFLGNTTLKVWLGAKKHGGINFKWEASKKDIIWTPRNFNRYGYGECLTMLGDLWYPTECLGSHPAVCKIILKNEGGHSGGLLNNKAGMEMNDINGGKANAPHISFVQNMVDKRISQGGMQNTETHSIMQKMTEVNNGMPMAEKLGETQIGMQMAGTHSGMPKDGKNGSPQITKEFSIGIQAAGTHGEMPKGYGSMQFSIAHDSMPGNGTDGITKTLKEFVNGVQTAGAHGEMPGHGSMQISITHTGMPENGSNGSIPTLKEFNYGVQRAGVDEEVAEDTEDHDGMPTEGNEEATEDPEVHDGMPTEGNEEATEDPEVHDGMSTEGNEEATEDPEDHDGMPTEGNEEATEDQDGMPTEGNEDDPEESEEQDPVELIESEELYYE